MIPAAALSTAPRNEVSSQGCTTTVGTTGTALAAAISRSYLLGASLGPAGMTFMILLRMLAGAVMA
jgi:hypothetical protein